MIRMGRFGKLCREVYARALSAEAAGEAQGGAPFERKEAK